MPGIPTHWNPGGQSSPPKPHGPGGPHWQPLAPGVESSKWLHSWPAGHVPLEIKHESPVPDRNRAMSYHHLALAARDMAAIHRFYEDVMGFELVKVEVAPVQGGGWAKHFFYRMDGDDSRFIAFWELHEVPGTARLETNLSRAAGVPEYINHIAFAVSTAVELERRKARWLAAG